MVLESQMRQTYVRVDACRAVADLCSHMVPEVAQRYIHRLYDGEPLVQGMLQLWLTNAW